MTDSNLKPNFNVFVVTETGSEKNFWHKVGAAWNHREDGGLNIRLDFPVGVTDLVLLPPKEDA